MNIIPMEKRMFSARQKWTMCGLYGIVFLRLCAGDTHILGDISSISFTSSGNPFIVEKDIEVPPGKKVTVGPGCVFLFNEFTGLKILGAFIVNGTEESRVVFTSLRDTSYTKTPGTLPNPFDWNGIFIGKRADSVFLNNFQFYYSVYGIKSQKEEIVINGGYFKSNGQFDFTINDRILYIQTDQPYFYRMTPMQGSSGNKPDKPTRAEIPLKKRVGHWCFYATPVFLLTGGVFYYFARQDYRSAQNADNYLKHALLTNDEQYALKQREYRDKQAGGNTKKNAAFTVWGLGVGVLGAGILLSF
jgi:hypothetical protein